MARQIIKQPNGKYCVYCSIEGNITHYNCTPEEIITEWVEEMREDITKKVNRMINGEKPYQNTYSFAEALEMVKSVHGGKEIQEITKLIETSN
jgi:hypothetical protein